VNGNPAERVIRRFGGQSALAQLLGKRQSTVEHWAKTGRIPAQWHQALLALARQRGIILEAKDFMETSRHQIESADGRLGVLTVGLGAVASTFVAGVELIRRGLAEPVGSLTQMGTIRLGKRTEDRVPLIRDFVPLAGIDQLVFGAWDPIPDTAYDAAVKCGVLDRHEHIEPIADVLKEIKPSARTFAISRRPTPAIGWS
jgi:myo-inositol-1-phosphate synthase